MESCFKALRLSDRKKTNVAVPGGVTLPVNCKQKNVSVHDSSKERK